MRDRFRVDHVREKSVPAFFLETDFNAIVGNHVFARALLQETVYVLWQDFLLNKQLDELTEAMFRRTRAVKVLGNFRENVWVAKRPGVELPKETLGRSLESPVLIAHVA